MSRGQISQSLMKVFSRFVVEWAKEPCMVDGKQVLNDFKVSMQQNRRN